MASKANSYLVIAKKNPRSGFQENFTPDPDPGGSQIQRVRSTGSQVRNTVLI
jgi:hypothetical protein